jgi:hypothetical protein
MAEERTHQRSFNEAHLFYDVLCTEVESMRRLGDAHVLCRTTDD